MKRKQLTVLLPLLVVVTILASLISPSPVLAAGEPPPPPGEKSPKAPAAAPAKPAPSASDASNVVEAPVAAPSGAAVFSPVALAVNAVAQADAVLVGPSGNPLPLAAKDTINVLFASTVYFKGSGSPECTLGLCYYASIAGALAAFPFRNGVGTIYATGNLVESGAVDVINTPALNLSKLTGLAWDGTTNYSPWLQGGPLTIASMLKGFTVDGFSVFQGINAHDNAGTLRLQNLWVTNPAGYGILVTSHKGNIDLFNVTVSGASNSGAWLDNTAGAGNVTISNSSFNTNGDRGLYVNTNGSALLDRAEANANLESFSGEGAYLIVGKGATVKDSRFNYNQNGANGLLIYGLGAMNLQNVEAKQNSGNGIYVDTANDVTVNGGNFASNFSYGLFTHTLGGNITLNNIKSQGDHYGVRVDNSGSASPKTVTINNSLFSGSTLGDGLTIFSKGNVTLNHIDAEGNLGYGVYIDNALWDGISYKGSGSVNLLNTMGLNQLLGNSLSALLVVSKGAITVKGVYAYGNHGGLVLNGCAPDPNPPHNCLGNGNVTVSAVQVESTNTTYSLIVLTGGAISLDGSSFLGNRHEVNLNNSLVSTPKPVTVTNSSFNSTVDPASVGLAVHSKGNITLNNVQATLNIGKLVYGPMSEPVSGFLLDNCIYVGSACTGSGTVSVLSSLGPSKAIGNGQGDGLFIYSKGAITVSGFSSTFNGGGAFIINSLGAGTLTITKSAFSNNSGVQGGLSAYSTRAITLTGVEASLNTGGPGATVHNSAGTTTTDPITISKSHFDHNKNYGLDVMGKGNVTLNNVSANLNNITATTYGANLRSLYGGVTLQDTLGPNLFSFNAFSGLNVSVDNGAISISGVTASFNSISNGINLNNASAAATKTVTALKILAAHNGLDGLDVRSKGSITLNGVQANFNASRYGVYIDNCILVVNCTGSGNVSLLSTLGLNSMSNNRYGLWIESAGSVLVNGAIASNNTNLLSGVSGVWIRNLFTPGKTVTVNQGNFNSNNGTGLYIGSAGVITLNKIGASYNLGVSGSGIFLRNDVVGSLPGVNILSTSGINQLNGNAAYGLYVYTGGNIVLSKVIASDNGAVGPTSGAVLQTSLASSVTITCSAFNHNQVYGLDLLMGTGTLAFKSVAANNNISLQDFHLNGKAPVMSWTVCGH